MLVEEFSYRFDGKFYDVWIGKARLCCRGVTIAIYLSHTISQSKIFGMCLAIFFYWYYTVKIVAEAKIWYCPIRAGYTIASPIGGRIFFVKPLQIR